MSYVGKSNRVETLFNLLNPNTIYYHQKMFDSLKEYIVPWRDLIEFGDKSFEWTHEYPDEQ